MSANKEDHVTLVNRPRDYKKMQRKNQEIAEQMRKNKELKELREREKLEKVQTEPVVETAIAESSEAGGTNPNVNQNQEEEDVESIHQPD